MNGEVIYISSIIQMLFLMLSIIAERVLFNFFYGATDRYFYHKFGEWLKKSALLLYWFFS